MSGNEVKPFEIGLGIDFGTNYGEILEVYDLGDRGWEYLVGLDWPTSTGDDEIILSHQDILEFVNLRG